MTLLSNEGRGWLDEVEVPDVAREHASSDSAPCQAPARGSSRVGRAGRD